LGPTDRPGGRANSTALCANRSACTRPLYTLRGGHLPQVLAGVGGRRPRGGSEEVACPLPPPTAGRRTPRASAAPHTSWAPCIPHLSRSGRSPPPAVPPPAVPVPAPQGLPSPHAIPPAFSTRPCAAMRGVSACAGPGSTDAPGVTVVTRAVSSPSASRPTHRPQPGPRRQTADPRPLTQLPRPGTGSDVPPPSTSSHRAPPRTA
jgi:hypothetical protein